jgi:SAM domain (Sterile alpha motif)
MDSLSSWLDALGLEQYLPLFERNGIGLRSLPLLGESDLERASTGSQQSR